MFDIKVIFLFSFAVATAYAEFTVEMAADYADDDGDGIISTSEFNRWKYTVSEHEKARVILSITGEIPVSKFISVLESTPKDPRDMSQFTAQDAANFVDKDKDDFISADEFGRWFKIIPKRYDQTTTVFMFTGNIPVEKFSAFLDYLDKSSPFPSEYTVQQAVNYFDRNQDNEIDASEFDEWYGITQMYIGEKLEAEMTKKSGTITKEEFIRVLNLYGLGLN